MSQSPEPPNPAPPAAPPASNPVPLQAPDPSLALRADPEIHDPYIALRNPNYRRYFIGNAASLIGTQMTTYTITYELYQRSLQTDHAPLVLGLVGLVQVIPIVCLALPAGQLVDRYNRKLLILLSTAAQILIWLISGFSSRFANSLLPGFGQFFHQPDAHVPLMLTLLLFNGVCRAINQPAKQTLVPSLVPAKHFPNAVSWSSMLFEISNVVGPMTGGCAVAILLGAKGNPHDTWTFSIIYWLNALLQVVQWVNIARIHIEYTPRPREPITLHSMLAGVRHITADKTVLAAITLDLFAVLFGGATMLLPVIAQQVLFVGPIGLAVLRAAPSVGAVAMAFYIAHRPPTQTAGRDLLWAVTGFGIATMAFGFSRNFWLSIATLVLTGIFDNVSVVIRHSLIQLRTPDEMRGRVSAVNTMFISCSNELGDFESGTTTDIAIRILTRFKGLATGEMWGPIVAVVAGGAGTLAVVFATTRLWPELAAVRRLEAKREQS